MVVKFRAGRMWAWVWGDLHVDPSFCTPHLCPLTTSCTPNSHADSVRLEARAMLQVRICASPIPLPLPLPHAVSDHNKHQEWARASPCRTPIDFEASPRSDLIPLRNVHTPYAEDQLGAAAGGSVPLGGIQRYDNLLHDRDVADDGEEGGARGVVGGDDLGNTGRPVATKVPVDDSHQFDKYAAQGSGHGTPASVILKKIKADMNAKSQAETELRRTLELRQVC
jgi:hypothetical protein